MRSKTRILAARPATERRRTGAEEQAPKIAAIDHGPERRACDASRPGVPMGMSFFRRAMILAAAGFVGTMVLTAGPSTFAADAPDSTVLFYHAHVFTAEPNAPYAEA